jgi:hypothetical protein
MVFTIFNFTFIKNIKLNIVKTINLNYFVVIFVLLLIPTELLYHKKLSNQHRTNQHKQTYLKE